MNNSKKDAGIGFVGALQIVFIVLKLVHKISWSWIWVLSPTWISTLFIILCVVLYVKMKDKQEEE